MKKFAAISTTAVLLAITLAACTQTATVTEPTSKPSASSAPAGDELAADTDGDGTVSAFEQQVADQKAPRDYVMPNGNVIKVDPTVPLTDVVKAAVVEAIAPAAAARATPNPAQEVKDAYRAAINSQAEATGRGIVVVQKAVNVGFDSQTVAWAVIASGHEQGLILADADKAAKIAFATEWAAPRGFEVIVMD